MSFSESVENAKMITMWRNSASISAIFVLCISSIYAEHSKDAILLPALSSADSAHPSSAIADIFLIADVSRVRRRRSVTDDLPPPGIESSTDQHESSSHSFLNSSSFSSSSSEHSGTFHNHSKQSTIKAYSTSSPADYDSSTTVTTGSIPPVLTTLREAEVDPGEFGSSDQNSSFGLRNDDVTPSLSFSSSPTAPTVSSLTGENVTVIEDQNHVYYRSSVATGLLDAYWANEDVMFGVTEHASLSNSHRSAATIPLSFTFQFYGHEINQVTIATGGFLYMSDFLHQWLTATQYIAPMMANFDTQLGNNSNVHYMDNGSAFIVWWQDVVIDDLRHIGPFNFQAGLFLDGRIVFSYKKVPIALREIPSGEHPVKVGISDAYYVDKPTNSNVKRRTIYEYHRIEINMSQIVSDVVVIITPLPTCRVMRSCSECLLSSIRLSFNCQWCSSLRRCSDGLDRQRQKWLETGCPNDYCYKGDVDERVQSVMSCNQSSGNGRRWDGDVMYDDSSRSNLTSSSSDSGLLLGPSIAGLILIVLGISLLLYLIGWLLYAFAHPNSPSGRWLIEHRPSKLRMRLSHVKFFIQSENGANNYIVSMQQEVDANA